MVNANGFDITARDIFIGRFGNAGDILNDGAITATRNLEVSAGTFSLDADDNVAMTVTASSGGTLNLHANTAAQNATMFSAGTINTVATSNLSGFVQVIDQGSLLNMGANLVLSQDLDIRGTGTNLATVNANGFDITARDIFIGRFGNAGDILNDGAITATRNLEVSRGTFSLDADDSVAMTVTASSGGTLNLHANTAAQNATMFVGGTINTVATSNLSGFVQVIDQGSLLNMGANLVLSQDLDIRGTGTNLATVNANGFDITARDIFIGRFGNAGDILNDGAITATRNLEVSRGTFSLDADDSVAMTVTASSGGTLNLHANTAAQNATMFLGGTINTVATSNLSGFVQVIDQGSLLNMGANLVLAQDLETRGTGTNVATVNANGFDITARDIYIGRFGNAGDILNDGAITATRNLEVSRGTFSLDANDSVAMTVTASSGGTLNLHANTAAQNATMFLGGTINTVATSNLSDFVQIIDQGSLMNMGANLVLAQDLETRGTGTNVATVNANGFDITARDIFIGRFGNAGDILNDGAITATRNLEVSAGTFSLDADDSVAVTATASSGGTLNLHANTAAQNATMFSGGTINTAAASNLNGFVQVTDQGSLLNAQADLNLSGDVDVRGTMTNVATVNLNGNNLAANTLFVGRFANSGRLINDGAVTVNQLSVDSSSLDLTGGNDTVLSAATMFNACVVNVLQAAGETTGLTLDGNTLSILDTSVLHLDFDNVVVQGLDWAFRWANPGVGDRVTAINALIGGGQITIQAPSAVSVFDHGDGYTYVGFVAVPEPGMLGGLLTALMLATCGRRRRNR